MTRGTPSWHRGLLAASLLAVAGCGFALDSEPAAEVQNRCDEDGQCLVGSCDLSVGLCVSNDPVQFPLAFRITPVPEATGLTPVPRHVEGGAFNSDFLAALASDRAVDLMLPGVIAVVGDVCEVRSDELCGPHVQASLTFIEEPTTALGGPAPGEAFVLGDTETVSLTNSARAVALDGLVSDYAVRLVRGREYQVVVEPIGEDAARLYPLRRRIRVPDTGDVTRISFMDWPARELFLGKTVNEEGDPVAGLRIEAVDRETLEVVSSTAKSGTDGSFSLSVDPSVTDYLISLRAGESTGTGAPVPTLLQDPNNFFPSAGVQRILVPTTPALRVQGRILAVGSRPVADAVVRFVSNELLDFPTGQLGAFQSQVSTDDAGRFAAALVPGSYQVVITPPGGREDAGVQALLRDYRAGTSFSEEWTLPPRAVVSGSVQSFSEEAMAEVRVVLTALRREEADLPAARYNRSNDSTTGFGGMFALPVDEGRYDLTVRPPQDSGFAWWVASNRRFERADAVDLQVRLPVPVSVQGRIVSDSGEPIGNAELEAFALVPDSTKAESRWLPVGRTTSHDDGSYTLLLPPSIE